MELDPIILMYVVEMVLVFYQIIAHVALIIPEINVSIQFAMDILQMIQMLVAVMDNVFHQITVFVILDIMELTVKYLIHVMVLHHIIEMFVAVMDFAHHLTIVLVILDITVHNVYIQFVIITMIVVFLYVVQEAGALNLTPVRVPPKIIMDLNVK
jgi:hypothetical protein